MENLFIPLMGLGLISPIASIAVAFFLFVRHRERVERERQVSAAGFVVATIFFAAIGGFLGGGNRSRGGLSAIWQPLRPIGGLHHRTDLLFARNFTGWDLDLSDPGSRETRRRQLPLSRCSSAKTQNRFEDPARRPHRARSYDACKWAICAPVQPSSMLL